MRHRSLRGATCLIAMVLFSGAAVSVSFDDLGNLQGKLVVYAGEFETVDCPIGSKYDCLTWPTTMLKTRKGPEMCIGSDRHVRCGFKCTGLIAVGEDKVPKAYVFSQMSSEATEVAVERYRCPEAR